MNKWMETLLAATMALGPTIIAVTMMKRYGPLGIACSLIFSGIYMLVLVLALTLRNCLRRRYPRQDQEQLQNPEEEDCPPSYEVVTAKPPPYSLLFSTAPPTGDVTSCSMTAECAAPVHHLLPQHSQPRKSLVHCYTWIKVDPEASPPSYIEAVRENNSPHPSESTSPSTPPIGNSPPSPPIGTVPPSSLQTGNTLPSPTFSSTVVICHPPSFVTSHSPNFNDTKHFPT